MREQTEMAADKTREARLRRVAAGMGLALRKSRTRDPERMDFGRYRIIRVETDYVVAGRFPYGYTLSLDAIEDILEEMLESEEQERMKKAWEAVHGTAGEFDAKY